MEKINSNIHLKVLIFLIALAVFIFHAYKITSRYAEKVVMITKTNVRNHSLAMPAVHMQMNTYRSFNATIPHANISYKATLDNVPLELWAFYEFEELLDRGDLIYKQRKYFADKF